MTLNPREKAVLDYIKKDENLRDYFFRHKVSEVKWFHELKKLGFFEPNCVPQPIKVKEGLYRIPDWSPVYYLERISEQIKEGKNTEYADELLKIIKNVSTYKDSEGNHIDNYTVWHSFIKIFINLPNEKITDDIIELIPIWLKSKFGTDIQSIAITEKLLPKFLLSENKEDWKKAEKILVIITDLKEVESTYKKTRILLPVVESYSLRDLFKEYGGIIGKICSPKTILEIAQRLLKIISTTSYNFKKADNYQLSHTIKEGKHLIELHHIRYSKDDMPENKEYLFGFEIDKPVEKQTFINTAKEKFISKAQGKLSYKVLSVLIGELEEALSSIYHSIDYSDYSYIWYPALSGPEKLYEKTEILYTFILKNILTAKAQYNIKEICKVLDKFFDDEFPYPIFKRLAIFVLSQVWGRLKKEDNEKAFTYFTHICSKEAGYFDDAHYEPELAEFLKSVSKELSEAEKRLLKDVIERGPADKLATTEKQDKYEAYWRQKWLYYLCEDQEFMKLYEKQKNITGIDFSKINRERIYEPPVEASPLTPKEILNLPIEQLVKNLKEFKSSKAKQGQTIKGFAQALSEAVKAKPDKFIKNLHFFKDVDFVYVCNLLYGLHYVVTQRKPVDWNKILDFIDSYVKQKEFWKDKLIIDKDRWQLGTDHNKVIRAITDLIKEGLKREELQAGSKESALWIIPKDYLQKTEKIVLYLIEKQMEKESPDKEKTTVDYLTHTLNTTYGSLLEVLMCVAIVVKQVGIYTDPEQYKKYTNILEKMMKRKFLEAYTIFGYFLPSLTGMNKKWTKQWIDKIYQEEKGTKYWEAFLAGHLFYKRVYPDVYDMMRKHYEYGFSYKFENEDYLIDLIQTVSVGFLIEKESLEKRNSLFRKIAGKPEYIHHIIECFKLQPQKDKKLAIKIIEFWRWLYDKYKNKKKLTQKDKKVLSDTLKLTIYLDKIDEESFEWLKLGASYLQGGADCYTFIEQLNRLKDKGDDLEEVAIYISEIYLTMLKNVVPDYKPEDIISVVNFLYENGSEDKADRICEIYMRKGYFFLDSVFRKYH